MKFVEQILVPLSGVLATVACSQGSDWGIPSTVSEDNASDPPSHLMHTASASSLDLAGSNFKASLKYICNSPSQLYMGKVLDRYHSRQRIFFEFLNEQLRAVMSDDISTEDSLRIVVEMNVWIKETRNIVETGSDNGFRDSQDHDVLMIQFQNSISLIRKTVLNIILRTMDNYKALENLAYHEGTPIKEHLKTVNKHLLIFDGPFSEMLYKDVADEICSEDSQLLENAILKVKETLELVKSTGMQFNGVQDKVQPYLWEFDHIWGVKYFIEESSKTWYQRICEKFIQVESSLNSLKATLEEMLNASSKCS